MSNRKAAELANRIEIARTNAGQTKERVSETTGIPYSTLNRKLTVSPEKFTVQEVAAIAVALNVEFSDLFGAGVAA